MPALPIEDLNHVLEHAGDAFHALAGSELFVTGGTAFVGKWLVETLLYANDRLKLDVSAVILTRNPERFLEESPHLARHPAVRLLRGDIGSFAPPRGNFPYVIHAASTCDNPEATRHVLEFASSNGVRRLLFTSSGAVYGTQPADISHVPEEYSETPSAVEALTEYGQEKRLSEILCSMYACQHKFSAMIARLFTFSGPYLPLNLNFAVGNFIDDVLAGRPILIRGDGTPYRSYLYAADLAIWLWTILVRGDSTRPYNVGSPDALTILELARLIAEVGAAEVGAAQTTVQMGARPEADAQPTRYVPSTVRAEKELGLRTRISVREGVRRTIHWHWLNR